jgi:ABC-type multidrug transport system ATPase subunit
VDPETRRGIWSLIQREKQGRCVVLTTHSMEEADVLCDNIGIMAHGRLKALGGTQHLKTKFSDGFKLSVTFTREGAATGHAFVRRVAPSAKAVEQFSDTAVYMVSRENESMAAVFQAFQRSSVENGIEDWGMRQTSLEEVFVAIAKEAEEKFGMA